MASIITLTQDQINQLQDQINSLTQDNVTLAEGNIELTNVLSGRTITDELLGAGDGANVTFQTTYFPIDVGSVDLRFPTIVGTALVDPTDFSIDLATGTITLTAAGLTALGFAELHIAYTVPGIDDVDATIRAVHEAIESGGITLLERELKFMKGGPFPTAAEIISETKIVDSVTDPFTGTAVTTPLYPSSATPPANPEEPFPAVGLFGGTDFFVTNEFDENAGEFTDITALLAFG